MKKESISIIIGGTLVWGSIASQIALETIALSITIRLVLFALGMLLLTIGITRLISIQHQSDIDQILEKQNSENQSRIKTESIFGQKIDELLLNTENICNCVTNIQHTVDMINTAANEYGNKTHEDIKAQAEQHDHDITILSDIIKEEANSICIQSKNSAEMIIGQQKDFAKNNSSVLQNFYNMIQNRSVEKDELLSNINGVHNDLVNLQNNVELIKTSININSDKIHEDIKTQLQQYDYYIKTLNDNIKDKCDIICTQSKKNIETIINQQNTIAKNENSSFNSFSNLIQNSTKEKIEIEEKLIGSLKAEIISLNNKSDDDAASIYRKIGELCEILKNSDIESTIQEISDDIIGIQSKLHKINQEIDSGLDNIENAQDNAAEQSQLQHNEQIETYKQQITNITDKISEYVISSQKVLEQYITVSKEDNALIDTILRE